VAGRACDGSGVHPDREIRARCLTGERGQTSAEYLGLVVLIVAILAAVATTDIGKTLASTLSAAISSTGEGAGPAGGSTPGSRGTPGAGPAAPGGQSPAGGIPGARRAPTGEDGAAPESQPSGEERAAPAAEEEEDDDGGGFGGFVSDVGSGLRDAGSAAVALPGQVADGASTVGEAGVAFADGLVRGDFNREGSEGWREGFRSAGQVVSGLVAVGDIRDAGAAGVRLVQTGGREGWGDLGLSAFGVIPIAGDLAKGTKAVKGTVDAIRGSDEVAGGARALDDAPRPPRGLEENAPPARSSDGDPPPGRSDIGANKEAGDTASDRIASRFPGARREVTFQTSEGPRRVDVLTDDGLAIESKVGRTSNSSFVRAEVRKDAEVLSDPDSGVDRIEWEFSRSEVTGKSGPTPRLREALERAGITIVEP
jgi:hypothetical protein